MRKIRNNLRNLLLEWDSRQLDGLFNMRDKIERNGLGKMKRFVELTGDEKEKIEYITHQITKIRKLKNASICQCVVCGASDKDMTYNPVEKQWFCVDCYKANQDYYKNSDEAYLYP